MTRLSSGHARTFATRFGAITVQRTRGYCKRRRKWRPLADTALGLEDNATLWTHRRFGTSWLFAGSAHPQRFFGPVRIDETQKDGGEEPVHAAFDLEPGGICKPTVKATRQIEGS